MAWRWRGVVRFAAWGCLGLGAASWGALGLGLVRRGAGAAGPLALVNGKGTLGVMWLSDPVRGDWPESVDWPMWTFASQMRLTMGPFPEWRPSYNEASMSVGSGPGAVTHTFRAVWVPLWWPGVALPLAGLALWRVSRGHGPGRCAGCGYEVGGLRSGVCPECGGAIGRGVAREDRRGT